MAHPSIMRTLKVKTLTDWLLYQDVRKEFDPYHYKDWKHARRYFYTEEMKENERDILRDSARPPRY